MVFYFFIGKVFLLFYDIFWWFILFYWIMWSVCNNYMEGGILGKVSYAHFSKFIQFIWLVMPCHKSQLQKSEWNYPECHWFEELVFVWILVNSTLHQHFWNMGYYVLPASFMCFLNWCISVQHLFHMLVCSMMILLLLVHLFHSSCNLEHIFYQKIQEHYFWLHPQAWCCPGSTCWSCLQILDTIHSLNYK